MTAERMQPSAGGGPSRPGLRVMRCARHGEREAVARCPSCGASYCRECVSEHEGRLLCASCLSREVAAVARPAATKRDWSAQKRALSCAGAFVFLWALLTWGGVLLSRVPSEVHEGSVWRPFDPEK